MLDLITTEEQLSKFKGRFQQMAALLPKFGCEVDHLLKKDLKRVYLRYLKFRPDVVVSVSEAGPLPAFFKKLRFMNVPHVHDWIDDYLDVNAKDYGISFIAFCQFFTVANADFIITPSIHRKVRCELWGKKVFYVPQGVDAGFDAKEPANLEGNIKVVYSGEQSERKRVDKLIKAVDGLDCTLYLFGETNEKFRMNAPPNVHFMGFVSQSELPRYLKAADILAISADDDCTLKMYEYIKAGRAILGIRGKLNYVLTHLENAYLADDLSQGLRELINNAELRNRLAQNVQRFKVYTWDEAARMYLDALTQGLEEYHASSRRDRRRKMGKKSLKSFLRSTL